MCHTLESTSVFEERLDQFIQTMKNVHPLYQPTAFWSDASVRVANELRNGNVVRFRRLPGPLGYFVPTYGRPGNGWSADQVDATISLAEQTEVGAKARLSLAAHLDGSQVAEADYRVLMGSGSVDRWPNSQPFVESEVGQPIEQFQVGDSRHSRSSLNYSLGLAYLTQLVGDELPSQPRVLEIGGGFGSLAELLMHHFPGSQYIDLDIYPAGPVAAFYLTSVFGMHKVATQEKAGMEMDSLPAMTVLGSHCIELMSGHLDLFVNFISFQEMEPAVVSNYLKHVRRLGPKFIMLRNLRQGKPRRDSSARPGVDEPILSDDYLDMIGPYELIGKDHFVFGHQTVDGFHSELMVFQRR